MWKVDICKSKWIIIIVLFSLIENTAVTEAHRDVIQQHYSYLLESLDTKYSDLVEELWTSQVLDQSEREDIACVKSSYRRNEKLLSALYRKSTEQFQLFLQALTKTGQHHLRIHIAPADGIVPVIFYSQQSATGRASKLHCMHYVLAVTLFSRLRLAILL